MWLWNNKQKKARALWEHAVILNSDKHLEQPACIPNAEGNVQYKPFQMIKT